MYGFLLGNNAGLSIAELYARFGEMKELSDTHAFFASSDDLTQNDFDSLGGSIHMDKEVHLAKNDLPTNKLVGILTDLIMNDAQLNLEKKVIYAINIYPIHFNNKKLLKNLLKATKKELTIHDIKSRFTNKESKDTAENLDNIRMKKEILDNENAVCYNIHMNADTYRISKLIACQNADSYSKRDFDKPCRDAKNGMLPPKLSQILINLATDKNTQTIVDPFCGTGGLLIEAVLMGYGAIGSDIEPKMIEMAEKNFKWLEANFKTNTNKYFYTHDAKLPFPDEDKTNIVIATEGYLGPPLSDFPAEENARKTFQNIAGIYKDFFKNLSKYDTATIAICLPCYLNPRIKNQSERIKNAKLPLKIIEEISKAEFELLPVFKNGSNFTEDKYIYSRPDQIVGRMIIVCKKK